MRWFQIFFCLSLALVFVAPGVGMTPEQMLAVKSWRIDFTLSIDAKQPILATNSKVEGETQYHRTLTGQIDLQDKGPFLLLRDDAYALGGAKTTAEQSAAARALSKELETRRLTVHSWLGPHGKPSTVAPLYKLDLKIDDHEDIAVTQEDRTTSVKRSHESWSGHESPLLLNTIVFSIDVKENTYDLGFMWDQMPVLLKTEKTLTHIFNRDSLPSIDETLFHTAVWNDGTPKIRILGHALSGDPIKDIVQVAFKPTPRSHPFIPAPTPPLTATFTWTLAPAPPPELELDITIPDYETWMPEAGPDEKTPGPRPLKINVALRQKADGKSAEEPIKLFKFRLLSSSAEPGICLNWPVKANALTTRDLQFAANSKLKLLDAEGQVGVALKPSSRYNTILDCFDYGAYGELEVTAEMEDGRAPIIGHFKLKGKADVTRLEIPRRTAGSVIADLWKERHGSSNLADNDDNESIPGNAYNGDGLSLYEEYRGFYVDGKHVQGDPTKKDFFIVNHNTDARVDAGIKLFEQLGKIHVFEKVQPLEFEDRVINFNYGSKHLVDQHGTIIEKPTTSIQGFFQAVFVKGASHPCTPKDIEHVILAQDIFSHPRSVVAGRTCGDPVELSIAHELFHTCHVVHHGDNIDRLVEWNIIEKSPGVWVCEETVLDPDTKNPMGPAHEVTVMDPPTATSVVKMHNFTAKGKIKVNLGYPGGLYSGDADCVMRDDDEQAYVDLAAPNVRYNFQHQDCSGIQLCTSKAPGPNWPNGISPFGNATAGNCAAQVKVNDR